MNKLGIRTGPVVNQAPAEPESRELSEAAAECESPYIPTKEKSHLYGVFFLRILLKDSNGCGSEWSAGGAPEPHPD